MIKKIVLAFSSLYYELLMNLPDEFSKYRVKHFNKRGCNINRFVSISPNVRIRGRVIIDKGSSIAQNCSLNGCDVGIYIGQNVMIAPNVVIVAFNHGFDNLDIPMVKQLSSQSKIIIEDDVWIGSNCTIVKDVIIGKGSIIGANSFVNKSIPPYSIVGGVAAKVIKLRV